MLPGNLNILVLVTLLLTAFTMISIPWSLWITVEESV